MTTLLTYPRWPRFAVPKRSIRSNWVDKAEIRDPLPPRYQLVKGRDTLSAGFFVFPEFPVTGMIPAVFRNQTIYSPIFINLDPPYNFGPVWQSFGAPGEYKLRLEFYISAGLFDPFVSDFIDFEGDGFSIPGTPWREERCLRIGLAPPDPRFVEYALLPRDNCYVFNPDDASSLRDRAEALCPVS